MLVMGRDNLFLLLGYVPFLNVFPKKYCLNFESGWGHGLRGYSPNTQASENRVFYPTQLPNWCTKTCIFTHPTNVVYYSHHLAERPQQRAFAGPYTIILQPFSKGEKEKKSNWIKKNVWPKEKNGHHIWRSSYIGLSQSLLFVQFSSEMKKGFFDDLCESNSSSTPKIVV